MHLCDECVETKSWKMAKEETVKPGGGGVKVLSPPMGGSRYARLNLAAFRSCSVTTVHAVT